MSVGGWSREYIGLAVLSKWTTRVAAVLIATQVALAVAGLGMAGGLLSVAVFASLVVGVFGGIFVITCVWSERHRPLPSAGETGFSAVEQSQLRALLLDGRSVEPGLRPVAGVLVVRSLAGTVTWQWLDVIFIAVSATQLVSNTSGVASRIFSGVLIAAFLAMFLGSLRDGTRWRRALADPALADHVRPN